MAHTKSQGSSSNGRDSQGRRIPALPAAGYDKHA